MRGLRRLGVLALVAALGCATTPAPAPEVPAKKYGWGGQPASGGGGGITSLTGDVTGSGTGAVATTISAGAVTLADHANMATASFLGRLTAGSGAPEVLSAANAWSVLGVQPAANVPIFTGDITTAGGALATTLAASGVTAGSCTSCNLTIDAKGRVTVQGNGSAGTTYTFSSGLTNTSNTITDDLATGKAGGLTATGGTLTGQNLTLRANGADTTTGHVLVTASGSNNGFDFDVANDRLKVGNSTPIYLNGPFVTFQKSNATFDFGTDTANGIAAYTNSSLRFQIGSTGNFQANNTPFVSFTSAAGARAQAAGEVFALAITPPTQATATSLALNAIRVDAMTETVTGTTAVTTATGVNFIDIEAPTITDASAAAFTTVSTMTIKGAVTMAGSATATNNYAFWVQGGGVRFDGAVDMRGAVIANAAIATALTSVGPTGSHTTVQEWFQVAGTSGTIRYVPGF